MVAESTSAGQPDLSGLPGARAPHPGRPCESALARLPDHWTVLHDVSLRGRPQPARLHLALSRAGLFAVTVLDWSRLDATRSSLLQHGARAVVGAASDAALILGGQLVMPEHTHALVCTNGAFAAAGTSEDVALRSPDLLRDHLTGRPDVLTDEHVGRVLQALPHLVRAIDPAAVPHQRTR
jgi:hypothetical protein